MRPIRLAAAGAAATACVLAATAFAGCAPMIPAGPMTSEDRDIEAVATVVLDTSGDLSVSEGEPSLVIRASAGALERLTSDVSGDTLVLGTTPGLDLGLGEVRYELTLPDLEKIELNGSGDVESTVSAQGSVRLELDGSGDVEWTGLVAERVEVLLAGSGDIELTGTTNELDLDLDGSGNIDAGELEAQQAVVSVSGSGNAEVAVSDLLRA